MGALRASLCGCGSVDTTSQTSNSPAAAKPEGTSLSGRVLSLLRSRGGQIFLRAIDGKGKVEELTFRDFFLHALITASLYDRFKVPIGGTVILVLSNPKDVFLAEAGALLTGRIPIVSAHPSAKLSLGDFSRTLLPLIDNAAPALIVGDRAYCSYLSEAIGRRVASFEDIVVPKALPQVVNSGDPTLFIQYSSGTTGTKKGVTISQEQLLWQVDAYAKEIGLTAADHIVSWLPYYHDMGLLTSLMMPLLTGTQVTIMSPFDWVKNPLMLLKAITQHRGTLTWLPNFAYNFLAQAAQRADMTGIDLSSLRGVVNCSEPVAAASHALFLDAFAQHGLKSSALAASYAMAETTFAITSGGFGHPLKLDHIDRANLTVGTHVHAGSHAIVSSGRILPGTEVRIFGADRAVLPTRHIGEIGVHSPSLMGGYFKNAALTAQVYADGFFLTGDLGYMDGGELFVTGRIKDLIITAGRNIYPQDIEATVNDIPEVVDGRCVAFGVADESKGTENVVIVAERKADADARALARAISQAVTARFDISLADVLIVEPGWLKKSTSGKIARGQNRDRYLEQKAKGNAPWTIDPSSPADVVRGCIHEATGIWVEDADAPLVTSGVIDSLSLTNLLLALEDAFKKTLPMPEDVGYDAYDSINLIAGIVSAEQKAKAKPFMLIIDRQVKANYVIDGARDFDSLIVGSSRTYLVQAKRAALHGLRAFHFSVAGARAEELYCMAAFFRQTNRVPLKHIIAGTDPQQFAPQPHLGIDLRLTKSPSLFAYLDEDERLNRGALKVEDADHDERSERYKKLIELRYRAWDVDLAFDTKTGDVTKLFGHDVATMGPLKYSDKTVGSNWAQQFMIASGITHLHPRRLQYLEKLIRLSHEIGCKLTIYTNPLHPHMIEQLKERTPYVEMQNKLVEHIRGIAHPGVTVHSLLTPGDFGGHDADFYDGVHMGRHNGDLLMDYLLTHG